MIWKSTGTLYRNFTQCSATLQAAATTGNAAADRAKIVAL